MMNNRRLKTLTLILAASFLTLGEGLWAGESAPGSETGGENPLSMLIGRWEVKEELSIGPDGARMNGKGQMVVKLGPGQHSILLEYATVEGPMQGFSLMEVIAKEPGEGKYSLIWVDAFSPGIKSMDGSFADGAFTFTSQEVLDGITMTTISRIVASSDGNIVISSSSQTGDEEPKPSMRLTASKGPGASGMDEESH